VCAVHCFLSSCVSACREKHVLCRISFLPGLSRRHRFKSPSQSLVFLLPLATFPFPSAIMYRFSSSSSDCVRGRVCICVCARTCFCVRRPHVDLRKLSRNTKVVAEALARVIYNLTEKVNAEVLVWLIIFQLTPLPTSAVPPETAHPYPCSLLSLSVCTGRP